MRCRSEPSPLACTLDRCDLSISWLNPWLRHQETSKSGRWIQSAIVDSRTGSSLEEDPPRGRSLWRELSSDDFRNAFQRAMCVDSTELPVTSSDYLHRILSASGLARIDLDQRSWIEPRTLLFRKPCSRRCTLRHPVCALRVRVPEVVEDAVQRGNDDEHEQRREPVRIDAAVARLRLGADEPRGDGEANRERNDQRPLMCSMWRMRSDRQASNNGRYDWPGLQTCHAEERGVLDGRKNVLMPGNFDRGPCRCAMAYQDGFIGGGGR